MRQFDPDWYLPSKLDRNPIAWMVEFNGLIMDVRHMPREVQEQAYERGMIPYIPADQPGGAAGSGKREHTLITIQRLKDDDNSESDS